MSEHQSIGSGDVGPLPFPPEKEKGKETPGITIETYQNAEGWWSFRINGVESHYRSSNEHGLERTVKAVMFGAAKGTVKLKALRADARSKLGSETVTAVPDTQVDWADLPTREERVKAFLSRGKLGKKEESPEK